MDDLTLILLAVIVILAVVIVVLLLTGKKGRKTRMREEFSCPECGARVGKEASRCPRCEALFDQSGYQCPNCGAPMAVDATKCEGCNEVFEESQESDLECPNCGAPVPPDTIVCENCHEGFWSPVHHAEAKEAAAEGDEDVEEVMQDGQWGKKP